MKRQIIATRRLLRNKALFAIGALAFSTIVEAQVAPLLVNETPSIETKILPSRYTTQINTVKLKGVLPAFIPTPNQPAPSQAIESITVNLSDDVSVEAYLTKRYKNASGSTTWVGKIDNQPDSTVIFIVNDGSAYGSIEIPELGSFSVRPESNGTHVIKQVSDKDILSGETDALIPPSNIILPEETPIAISNDDGSIIDVYVAYDQDAAGGSVAAADAQNYAELFVAYTNLAYENSHINQRVWLVGNVDGFNHTDINTGRLNEDLDAATNGDIVGLHSKRNEYHADLVLFFTPLINSNSCSGLAWLQTSDNVNFNGLGYSAMEACSFGKNVFAHELGHNMGSRHDWYMDNGVSPATIAHGHVDPVNQFRTIMSYGNRCSVLSTTCPTAPYFSNPQVNYNGQPTGVSAGTSSACLRAQPNPSVNCDADNKSNFNNKAAITSQFRDSRLTWTGAINTSWATAGNWTINEGAPGSTVATQRIPRSYDNVYIPSGLSRYPTITTTAQARELTIQNGATLNMTAGTLTVGWSWEDNGGFNATAGTVKFSGPIGITITSNSAFKNVQIGSGLDTTIATLNSDLNIDGNFTLNAGAHFNAGTYDINLAGNWQENNAEGFHADSGAVIFDGNTQSVDKITSETFINEDFSKGDGQTCCSTAYLPSTWTREGRGGNGWYAGQISGNGQLLAAKDGWLHTHAVSLASGVDYTFSFDFNQSVEPDTLNIHYGNAASSLNMTTLIGSVDTTGNNKTFTFSVPSTGTYYLGFHHVGTGQSFVDNVKLTGERGLNFYDVKVMSGTTQFNKKLAIAHNLETDTGATADFSTNTVTVENSVTNNGSLKQTKSVVSGLTDFARIKNKAGTTSQYYGIEITPSSGSMGSTEVQLKGNHTCPSSSASVMSSVKRCYIITPTNNQTAAVKFYYQSTESNGNTTPNLYLHTSASSWLVQSTASHGGSGDATWARVNNLTNYGTFSLSDNAITANTPPVAVADSFLTNENEQLTVAAALGVLNNDTDANNDSLTAILTNPSHGTLLLNTSGAFIYQPETNFSGDDSFTYKANDGSADSNTVTVLLTVRPANTNTAPVAVNDSYTINEDAVLSITSAAGVLKNDTDANNDSLTAILVTSPRHGGLLLNTNGALIYHPNANFNGSDSFTYQAKDSATNSNTATVTLTLNAVNDAPIAVADTYTTNKNTRLNTSSSTGVLRNDSDVENDPLTVTLVTSVRNGMLTINTNGSFSYIPTTEFKGVDSFTYSINDGSVSSNTVTVKITVGDDVVNIAPLIMLLFEQ